MWTGQDAEFKADIYEKNYTKVEKLGCENYTSRYGTSKPT
jgi:hypothetical protein